MKKKKAKHNRLGKPARLLWLAAYLVLLLLMKLRYRVTVERRYEGRLRGPALVLAPHTAECDPFIIGYAIYPNRPNFVVSAHLMAIPRIRRIFRILHVIPKKMFSADPATILNIGRAKREGNVVVLFPEGRLPCSGHSVPITAGTDALVSRLGVDVYVATCHGAYLTFPKWSKQKRRGRIRVEIQRVFTAEQIRELPPEEISARLNAAIAHNDEAAMKGVVYRCKKPAEGVDGILYRCPACNSELTLTATGDRINCTCGHTARLMQDYTLMDTPYFSTLGEWFLWQKDVLDTSVPLSSPVRIGTPDEKGNMNPAAGEGFATLTRDAITFEGTVNGEPLSFTIPTDRIGGLPITTSQHFDVYYNNRLYYVYPLPDHRITAKWVQFFDKLLAERSAALPTP